MKKAEEQGVIPEIFMVFMLLFGARVEPWSSQQLPTFIKPKQPLVFLFQVTHNTLGVKERINFLIS